MPGMENLAPERTDTSSGLSVEPNFAPVTRSSFPTWASISSSMACGSLRPSVYQRLQASVEMVKPGGTGRPAFVISASPAPLPPSRSFIVRLPSALPLAKA